MFRPPPLLSDSVHADFITTRRPVSAPAERFKAASRTGQIAAGMDADLVVFDGDPRADIRSLAQVRHVLHRGRIVYRDDARSCRAANRPG